jgi:hypothetical protein
VRFVADRSTLIALNPENLALCREDAQSNLSTVTNSNVVDHLLGGCFAAKGVLLDVVPCLRIRVNHEG